MGRSHMRCAACSCDALVKTLLVILLAERSNAQGMRERPFRVSFVGGGVNIRDVSF